MVVAAGARRIAVTSREESRCSASRCSADADANANANANAKAER